MEGIAQNYNHYLLMIFLLKKTVDDSVLFFNYIFNLDVNVYLYIKNA